MPAKSVVAIDAVSTATVYSNPIDAARIEAGSVVAKLAGPAVVGVLKLQATNDAVVTAASAWIDLPSAGVDVTNAGTYSVPVTAVCHRWLRVAFVYTSGGSTDPVVQTAATAGPYVAEGLEIKFKLATVDKSVILDQSQLDPPVAGNLPIMAYQVGELIEAGVAGVTAGADADGKLQIASTNGTSTVTDVQALFPAIWSSTTAGPFDLDGFTFGFKLAGVQKNVTFDVTTLVPPLNAGDPATGDQVASLVNAASLGVTAFEGEGGIFGFFATDRTSAITDITLVDGGAANQLPTIFGAFEESGGDMTETTFGGFAGEDVVGTLTATAFVRGSTTAT